VPTSRAALVQFRKWDMDGSGSVDRKEFGSVLVSLGYRCSPQVTREVFNRLDLDLSGTIEYKELEKALRKGPTSQNVEHHQLSLATGARDPT
jgi:Ca2+-binding EF-hand superfamily protein